MMRKERKKIVFTDSGLGGLYAFSSVYENLKKHRKIGALDLIFVNALYHPRKGYNKIARFSEKVDLFDSVLLSIWKKFRPGLFVIACNTLSVIYPKTKNRQFFQKTLNVVDAGLSYVSKKKFPKDAVFLIPATPTTIEENVHKTFLMRKGIDEKKIIPIPCPLLAGSISIHGDGLRTRYLVKKYMSSIEEKNLSKKIPLVLYLGSTHYSYIKNNMVQLLSGLGFQNVLVVDPSEHLSCMVVDEIAETISSKASKEDNLSLSIISRCELFPQEITTISNFLCKSPEVVRALTQYTLKENLF